MGNNRVEYRGFTIELSYAPKQYTSMKYQYAPTDYDGEPLRFNSSIEECKLEINELLDN